jgi:prephenate dehydratase
MTIVNRSDVAAYQGEPGAFSEQAAWNLMGPDAPLLPCRTLGDVFEAVASGRAAQAVVPFENTLAGTVPRSYELLLEHRLTAVAETCVRVEHMLIAHPSSSPAGIRRVLSHPVALDQCRDYLRARALEAVPVFDTAGAVGAVMDDADRTVAAIASRRAADLHGAAILAEGIQDHAENWTRFLQLVPEVPAAPRAGRKAMVVFELGHTSGSLARALNVVASLGLNLTKIESRPIPGRPFEYAFLVEMTCGDLTPDWTGWMDALGAVTSTLRLIAAF